METTVALKRSRTAPSAARRFVERTLRGWGVDAALDEPLLLVSELVTNAVLHGTPPISLHLDCDDRTVRIEVRDAGGAATPKRRRTALDEPGGRGLVIVEVLSDEWGYRPTPDGGTEVWCTYALEG